MTHTPRSLRINTTYNNNKFFKQKLRVSETATIADHCAACGDALQPVIDVCDSSGGVLLQRGACMSCGFVTFTRMPDGDWFERFYRSGWDLNRGEESITNKIEAPYEPLFDILGPRVGPDSRVLEIGSGYGGALNRLKQMGVGTLRGIEASAKRQEVCRDRLGLDVSLVTAEKMEGVDAIAGAAPYDVAFSWHVIEHVVDLDKAFAAIARLLRPGGLFVIGVPNFEHEHLVYLAHFLPHIHCFTPYSLTLLLARHGLAVEYIDDQIRAIARRVEGPVELPPRPAKLDVADVLVSKMARDIDLDRLSVGAPFFLEYDVVMSRVSAGTAQPLAKMDAKSRMTFALKRRTIGCGHNLRPILHPKFQLLNAIDPANAGHWITTHVSKFASMEFGGVLAADEPEKRRSGLPRLQFAYPGGHGYAWVK